METTEIYVLRHGQTDWNRRGALQGQLDTPLNSTGLAQAEQAAARLAGLSFEAVYTSPLRRARHTAHIATGWEDAALTPDPRLLEIAFGAWEGREIATLGDAVRPFFDATEAYTPPAEGETFAALVARAQAFLQDIAVRHKGQRVLAVSHSALMHAMLLSQDGRPLRTFWTPSFGNCAILRFSGPALQGQVLWPGVAAR